MKALCSIAARVFSRVCRILVGTSYDPQERSQAEPIPKEPKVKQEKVRAPKPKKKAAAETSGLLKASSL